jgi:hypothetical protein
METVSIAIVAALSLENDKPSTDIGKAIVLMLFSTATNNFG